MNLKHLVLNTLALFFVSGCLLAFPIYGADTPIESDFGDFLKVMQDVSPVLYRKVRETSKDRQIPVLLRSLGVDVRTKAPAVPPVVPMPAVYPAKLIYGNTLFYARIDALNAPQLKQLQEDLDASARLQCPPEIAILDLRNAGVTATPDCFADFLKYLTEQNAKKCPVLQGCAVLTSQKTAPNAQLLAMLLQKRGIAVNIGQKSEYPAYPMKQIEFHGQKLYLPVVTQDDLFAGRIVIVPVQALPVFPYESFGKDRKMQYDRAIRLAHDCLVAIRILSPQPANGKQ